MGFYKIVRLFQKQTRRHTMATGLYLEEAQAWCKNPETSSRTCTSPAKLRYTKRNGPWFDSYTEMR